MKTQLKILILSLFLSQFVLAQDASQTLTYDVIKDGEIIGFVKAQKLTEAKAIRFTMKSKVTVSIFFDVEIGSLFQSNYYNGYLINANTKNTRDGDVKESSKMVWDGTKYVFTKDGKKSNLKTKKIYYSLTSMYFKEPKRISRIFSERFGRYLPLKMTSNRTYELSLPNGSKNYYTYNEDGICTEVKVEHFLATVYFRLQKPPVAQK